MERSSRPGRLRCPEIPFGQVSRVWLLDQERSRQVDWTNLHRACCRSLGRFSLHVQSSATNWRYSIICEAVPCNTPAFLYVSTHAHTHRTHAHTHTARTHIHTRTHTPTHTLRTYAHTHRTYTHMHTHTHTLHVRTTHARTHAHFLHKGAAMLV